MGVVVVPRSRGIRYNSRDSKGNILFGCVCVYNIMVFLVGSKTRTSL